MVGVKLTSQEYLINCLEFTQTGLVKKCNLNLANTHIKCLLDLICT